MTKWMLFNAILRRYVHEDRFKPLHRAIHDQCRRQPADFVIDGGAFGAGLFLPRDDPDWFGRSNYPARLLLLDDRQLRIIPHPSSRQLPVALPLNELSMIEAGHILLMGWVLILGDSFAMKLPFNTRGSRPIKAFLRRLMADWPAQASASIDDGTTMLGDALTLKFRYALMDELQKDEELIAAFFQAPREEFRGRWFFQRKTSHPGDLVVLTSRRALCITERYKGMRERYGTIVRSTPHHRIGQINLRVEEGRLQLRVQLLSVSEWVIPLSIEHYQEALQLIHCYRAQHEHLNCG